MKDLAIIQYLNNLEVSSKLTKLLEQYQLEPKKADLVKKVIAGYLNQQLQEEEIADELNDKANIDFTLALDLAEDLISQFIPSLPPEFIKKIGDKDFSAKEMPADSLNEEIKKEANVQIESGLGKRFQEIIFNWFRNIRDDSETLDTLTRSIKVGGMGLDWQQGERVLAILKKKQMDFSARGIKILEIINKQIQAEGLQEKQIAEEEIDVAAKPVFAQQPQEKITGQEKTIEDLLKTQGVTFDQLPKNVATVPLPAATFEKASQDQLEEEKKGLSGTLVEEIEEKEEFLESRPEINAPPITPQTKEENIMPSPVQAANPAGAQMVPPVIAKPSIVKKAVSENLRPKMEDVKVFTEPELVGPVDELKALKIEDFRRLAKDPKEAIKKILSKIELLEYESLEKRDAGIKALKSSPLYKIYSEVMTEGIKQGKSFEQIIQANPIISLAEFKAIMDLNKSLKV